MHDGLGRHRLAMANVSDGVIALCLYTGEIHRVEELQPIETCH
jgi:hypothetical protein